MSDVKYTEDHEWLRFEDDGTITIGITDYAQEQLGDVVFAELPAVDSNHDAGSNVATIESVKTVGEIKLPVEATVTAVNERLNDEPELINSAPLDNGWIVRVKPGDGTEPAGLMDAEAYRAFVAGL